MGFGGLETAAWSWTQLGSGGNAVEVEVDVAGCEGVVGVLRGVQRVSFGSWIRVASDEETGDAPRWLGSNLDLVVLVVLLGGQFDLARGGVGEGVQDGRVVARVVFACGRVVRGVVHERRRGVRVVASRSATVRGRRGRGCGLLRVWV